MFKRFTSIVAAAAMLLASGAAFAQGQPPQWRYSWENNIATATFPGVVKTGSPATIPAIDVSSFGAACDRTTDDSFAVQAAIDFASTNGGGTVQFPARNLCRVNSTIHLKTGVFLVGQDVSSNSGLAAGTQNMDLISVDGNGGGVRNMYLVANDNGVNTAGTVIGMSAVRGNTTFEGLVIIGACRALRVNGSLNTFKNIYAPGITGAACVGVSVGDATTAGSSVNNLFDAVTVTSVATADRANTCWGFYDAGGTFLTHSEGLFCATGTIITPGAGQRVEWATFHDTNLGDQNSSNAFVISPSSATGTVTGLNCIGCWASTSAASGIYIENPNAGIVDGLNFIGARVINNAVNGFDINYTANVQISDSWVCSYTNAGINLRTGAGEVTIANTVTKRRCMNQIVGTGNYGVLLNGTNGSVSIDGLSGAGNSTAVVGGVPTGNSYVANVRDMFNTEGAVASATSIALGSVYNAWKISGATAIQTMTGGWNGRSVQLIATAGAITLSGGGNFCTAGALAQNVPTTARFDGTCWAIK